MNINTNGPIRSAAIIAGIALLVPGAAAFAQADEASNDETIDEIIVTGSRLKRRDFSSPSPIATIDRDALLNSGQSTLESTLNQMPQVIPHFDRTSNNPGNGTSTINLRGLGSNRTLVLLNGRRVAPSGVGTSVDVNNLPQVLIDRVEIITGGATTVYGSDAVAGVVNFITRQDFEGFGLDANVYTTEQGDSKIYDFNAAYGHEFSGGRGNVTVFGGYYDREATFAGQREFTAVPYQDQWFADGSVIQTGSSAIPAGMIPGPPADLGNGPEQVTFSPDGNPVAYQYPDDVYNFAPVNYLQTPLTRYSGGVFLNYDFSDQLESYAELTFTRNEARQNLAPVPFFSTIVTNTDNPEYTPATQLLLENNFVPVGPNLRLMGFRRRLTELGTRIVENNRDYLRVVTGLRGDISENWDFDVWASYTKSEEESRALNDASRSRFLQGLLVDPVSGRCFDPTGGCVPVNAFGEGSLSVAAVEFISLPDLVNITEREQKLVSGYVRGTPFDSWAGPVDVAFGAEWRSDNGNFEADDALFTGDALGFSGDASVNGSENVYELFAEAVIPLAQSLNLEIGGRYSDYKHAGKIDTYKIGGEWQAAEFLRFRGMFQRSVRAPNLLEAFQEQFTTFGEYVGSVPSEDPCSASADPVGNNNVEKCITTGLPMDQIGIFEANVGFPGEFLQGGNPNLTPEKADTFTVGLVFEFDAIASWQVAVDYFDLDITDTIGDLVPTVACFDPLNTANKFCDTFTRDPNTYDVVGLVQTKVNQGAQITRGVDTQVSVATDLPDGMSLGGTGATLSVNLIWTHVLNNIVQKIAGGTEYDCAGRFGWPCTDAPTGQTFPVDRVTTNLNYLSGDFSTHLTWRWIGSTENAVTLGAILFGVTDPIVGVPNVDAKNYVDLGFGYDFTEHLTARLTIANLFDTSPPFMADAVTSNNTDTTMYDIFGRSYSLSISLRY